MVLSIRSSCVPAARVSPGRRDRTACSAIRCLQPGQRGTETEVDALAEGEMPDRPAVDIELVRPLEVPLVAVRRADPRHQRGAGRIWTPPRVVSAAVTRYMDWTGER